MLYFRKTTDKIEQDVDDALFIIWHAIDYNIRTKVHQKQHSGGINDDSLPYLPLFSVQMKYGRFFFAKQTDPPIIAAG
jgi:hypothetical protein